VSDISRYNSIRIGPYHKSKLDEILSVIIFCKFICVHNLSFFVQKVHILFPLKVALMLNDLKFELNCQ